MEAQEGTRSGYGEGNHTLTISTIYQIAIIDMGSTADVSDNLFNTLFITILYGREGKG